MTTSSNAPRLTPITVTARTPEDLLAIAPVVLGFWPEESIVMLTFGADRPFHARVDLPPPSALTLTVRRQLEDLFLGPARRHRAQQLVLLYFSTDRAAAAAAHRALRQGCRRARIGIVTALFADGERFVELDQDPPDWPGTAYDVSAHPAVVEALVSGRLTHRSRGELAASVEPDLTEVDRVRAALDASGLVDDGLPVDGRAVRDAGSWVEDLVADLVATGQVPSTDQVARLLWVMQTARVRDAAWSLITPRTAAGHVQLWSAVVRCAADGLAAAPAALLGWAAWQAGDGARAWVAIDRCLRVEPGHPMATYLGTLLQDAVPPEFWEGGFDWTLGLRAWDPGAR